jgi:hypothetical protein
LVRNGPIRVDLFIRLKFGAFISQHFPPFSNLSLLLLLDKDMTRSRSPGNLQEADPILRDGMSKADKIPASTESIPTTDQPGETTKLWYTLVHWNELPHWRQDNQHIHGSYRQASYSYARSFQSIFHWHNESVNIWTHLIPGCLSLPCGLALYKTLQPRYERASTTDVIVMSCFFCGAAFCLGMSATFHAVSNHSPRVARVWNQLDYAGISVLIAGSFIPSVHYGFWCNPERQWAYTIMVSCNNPVSRKCC